MFAQTQSGPIIVGIHGVGMPQEGSIAAAVEKTLATAGLAQRVEEFNWNSISKQSLSESILSWNAIQELARALAVVSYPLLPARARPRSRILRSFETVREICFQSFELTLAGFFFNVAFVLPVFELLRGLNWARLNTGLFVPRAIKETAGALALAALVAIFAFAASSLTILALKKAQ